MKTNAKPDMHRVDQVGRAISRRLNEHAADLPHDITERLRVARMQAIAQRKPEPTRIFVPQLATAGGLGMGISDEGLNLWNRLASALPLIVLLFGLATIHVFQNEHRANEIAQLDAEMCSSFLAVLQNTVLRHLLSLVPSLLSSSCKTMYLLTYIRSNDNSLNWFNLAISKTVQRYNRCRKMLNI